MRGIAIVGLGYWGPNGAKFFAGDGIERWSAATSAANAAILIKSRYPSVLVTEISTKVLKRSEGGRGGGRDAGEHSL